MAVIRFNPCQPCCAPQISGLAQQICCTDSNQQYLYGCVLYDHNKRDDPPHIKTNAHHIHHAYNQQTARASIGKLFRFTRSNTLSCNGNIQWTGIIPNSIVDPNLPNSQDGYNFIECGTSTKVSGSTINFLFLGHHKAGQSCLVTVPALPWTQEIYEHPSYTGDNTVNDCNCWVYKVDTAGLKDLITPSSTFFDQMIVFSTQEFAPNKQCLSSCCNKSSNIPSVGGTSINDQDCLCVIRKINGVEYTRFPLYPASQGWYGGYKQNRLCSYSGMQMAVFFGCHNDAASFYSYNNHLYTFDEAYVEHQGSCYDQNVRIMTELWPTAYEGGEIPSSLMSSNGLLGYLHDGTTPPMKSGGSWANDCSCNSLLPISVKNYNNLFTDYADITIDNCSACTGYMPEFPCFPLRPSGGGSLKVYQKIDYIFDRFYQPSLIGELRWNETGKNYSGQILNQAVHLACDKSTSVLMLTNPIATGGIPGTIDHRLAWTTGPVQTYPFSNTFYNHLLTIDPIAIDMKFVENNKQNNVGNSSVTIRSVDYPWPCCSTKQVPSTLQCTITLPGCSQQEGTFTLTHSGLWKTLGGPLYTPYHSYDSSEGVWVGVANSYTCQLNEFSCVSSVPCTYPIWLKCMTSTQTPFNMKLQQRHCSNCSQWFFSWGEGNTFACCCNLGMRPDPYNWPCIENCSSGVIECYDDPLYIKFTYYGIFYYMCTTCCGGNVPATDPDCFGSNCSSCTCHNFITVEISE